MRRLLKRQVAHCVPPFFASNTPVLGAELLANGNFAAWTTDNPDGWTVSGEVGSDPAVHQVGAGEGHLGAGTGMCNLYSTSALVGVYQSVCAIGAWYRYALTLNKNTSGAVKPSNIGGNDYGPIFTGTGAKAGTFRARTTFAFAVQRNGGLTDQTIDDVTLATLALSSLLDLRADPRRDGAFEGQVTAAGPYQGGIGHWDSGANPQNGWLAYLETTSTAAVAKLCKVVAGTLTEVITGTVTYADRAPIRVVRSGTGFSLYYNGTQVGTTQTISDLPLLLRFGAFRTDPSVIVANVTHPR